MTTLQQHTDTHHRRRSLTGVSEAVLVERVRHAGEVWEVLLDGAATAGMLPSDDLARRMLAFLEGELPGAEAAHVELMRRWMLTEVATTQEPIGMWRGRDGR